MILGTPDYDRWSWVALEWIYGKILPGAYAHEHITHYTRKSLDQLIRAHEFEVLDCKYVGFSEMIFKAKKPPSAPDLQRMNYKTAAPAVPSISWSGHPEASASTRVTMTGTIPCKASDGEVCDP